LAESAKPESIAAISFIGQDLAHRFRLFAAFGQLLALVAVTTSWAASDSSSPWTWRQIGRFSDWIALQADGHTWTISPEGTLRYRSESPGQAGREGDEWTEVETPRGFTPNNLRVSADGTIFVIGRFRGAPRGTLLRGRTGPDAAWQELPVPCLGSLYGIDQQSDGTVWLTGERREVFCWKNGRWSKELTPLPYHNFRFRIFDNGTGWIMAETRSRSAVYFRRDSRWETVIQGPGDWTLLACDEKVALIGTPQGVKRVPKPGAGSPNLLASIPPGPPGSIALENENSGWYLRDGLLYRFTSAESAPVPIQGGVQRVKSLFLPGDGRLYASDGQEGLYELRLATPTESSSPFQLRPIQHASWVGAARIQGVTVVRMGDEEFLYLVDHEANNPTLRLDFRRGPGKPVDPFAWRELSQHLRNAGPDETTDWRYPYDISAVAADFNADGLEDIVLTGMYMGCRLFRNVRDDHFVDWTDEARIGGDLYDNAIQCGVLDVDSDGDLDLYVTNGLRPDRLYLNNGAARFSEVTDTPGLESLDSSGMLTCDDLDADGDTDIAVASWGRGLRLHENVTGQDAPPAFQTRTLLVDRRNDDLGRGLATDYLNDVAALDLDGDLLPELVVTSQVGPTRVFRNLGKMVFQEAPDRIEDPNAQPMRGITLGDLDGDGDSDMILTGTRSGRFFENRDGCLVATAAESAAVPETGGRTTGAAVLDFDTDGDLDVVLAADRTEVLFLENESDPTRTSMVRITGPASNRSAIGASVTLWSLDASRRRQSILAHSIVPGATGYGSGDSKALQFPIPRSGSSAIIDIALPGMKPHQIDWRPGSAITTVRLTPAGPLAVVRGAAYRGHAWLRDRWNMAWLLLLAGGLSLNITLLFYLFTRRERDRLLVPAMAGTALASILLYRFLPMDPGPALSVLASGLAPFACGITLVGMRFRRPRDSAPDLLLALSDSLRSFHHNEAPRRATDALLLTLNNIPEQEDDAWYALLVEDLQAYSQVVVPQLRSMSRMAEGAEVPGGGCDALIARQVGSINHILRHARHNGHIVINRARLQRLAQNLEALQNWIRRTRTETDKRLVLDLGVAIQQYAATRRMIGGQDLRIEVNVQENVAIRFRREDLDHVLDVLVENAMAAMARSPEPRVRIQGSLEATGTALLQVSDSGSGIPAGLQDRVFERGVTGSDRPGKGMGLYYARRTVERYGGRIALLPASTGATFGLQFEAIGLPDSGVSG
jgi:signal transduction histidine kinase